MRRRAELRASSEPANADRGPTVHRKGLYPIDAFPKALGSEAAGEIVALPTDEKVLNDEEYNLRKFAVGGKVAAAVSGKSPASSSPMKSPHTVPRF